MALQVTIVVLAFAAAIAAMLFEPTIRLRKRSLKLDYGSAPLLAVLFLAAAGCIGANTLQDALLGVNGLVPWEIIVVFFSGAYICVSIDATGLLEYASFKIVRMSDGSGRRLYLGLVFITAVLTIFTSNDVVTLTMTPIICYAAKHSKIDPIPFLLAVFFASNAWSMLFYVGNPPNIIVAQVLGLGFFEYARLMLLPTLAAGLSTMILVYFLFRKRIARDVSLDKRIKPESFLRNRLAAGTGLVLFAAFFITLAASESLGIKVWQVSLVFALIYAVINIAFALHFRLSGFVSHKYHFEKTKSSLYARNLGFNVSELTMGLLRVPWKMLPLIICFFIMVQLFTELGVTDAVASFIGSPRGPFAGPMATGILSALTANVIVNQPMTILFGNAFQSPEYAVYGQERLANGLALIAGANLGGNLTLFGALAGIMWARMLAYHGIRMDYRQFLKHSIKVTPIVLALTCLVISLEVAYLV